ncbi:MAG: glyceraldehyde 3-phosphate dehydrogenase NAD-binding domain-containing protein [Thermodesulfobacteriota bacterium]|nr:glyceraldehyde 3-phosphate dehydrogenase NAD-binding domain-containing protein [Thermodesulfobacteriota bacterium]
MGKVDLFAEKKSILGINGLGRIGKLTLWHHIGRKYFKEIIVNHGRKIGSGLDAVAQMIERDSTYGLMHTFLYGINAEPIIKIIDEKQGKLLIDGIPVTILREARNPKDIPWRDYGVDVVAECTGKFRDPTAKPDDEKGSIKGHHLGGAKIVINSSAFRIKNKALTIPEDAVSLIYGINHQAFDAGKHTLISAASCTTTALAHMIKPLLENEKTNSILTASMSTIHAVTNSQKVLDGVPEAGAEDLRKDRSILDNIILTSTNAAEALAQVIPEVKKIGFMADSVRIPVKTESLIILNISFQSRMGEDGKISLIDTKTINEIYKKVYEDDPERLLVYSEEQNVSSDVSGINASVVIEGQFNHIRIAFISVDLSQIPDVSPEFLQSFPLEKMEIPVVHAKIFGWYDNEYGSYTNRMGDLAVYVHKMLK